MNYLLCLFPPLCSVLFFQCCFPHPLALQGCHHLFLFTAELKTFLWTDFTFKTCHTLFYSNTPQRANESPDYKYIQRCFSTSFTLSECSLGQEDLMSSGGTHRSLGVSTLIRNTLPMVGQQWWPSHCPSTPLGFQLNSSLLVHNQQEALSAASPILWAAVFLSFPVIPMAVSIPHTDWAGNPRPGTAMPAILSPCSHAEGLGIWHSPFQRPVHTPLPMGL